MTRSTPRRLLLAGILATALSTTACTMTQQPNGNPEEPYPPTAPPQVGDIVHLPTGTAVDAERMLAAASDARIVYVGETHDNPASHRLELQVLEAVAERHPGETSLGMEMFNTAQQVALDRWVAGELDEKGFLKEVGWYDNWRMDYAYYREILEYARAHGIRVVGLNATRETVKAVGMQAPESLDSEIRDRLPELDQADPYQRAMAEAIFSDHSQGPGKLDSFLRIQTLWDETMAENIVAAMADKGPGHRMVIMAGGNHVRYGFGIPRRTYRRLPLSYVLIGSRELVIPEEKRDSLMNVDMPRFPMPPYDYLVYTEYESLPGKPVKLGVRMKEEDGRVVVEGVVPGSAAELAGVTAGDVILALDGTKIVDSFDLIYEVGRKQAGDAGELLIERDGTELKLAVTFTPMPKPGAHK